MNNEGESIFGASEIQLEELEQEILDQTVLVDGSNDQTGKYHKRKYRWMYN
jgi:hypothetical protein